MPPKKRGDTKVKSASKKEVADTKSKKAKTPPKEEENIDSNEESDEAPVKPIEKEKKTRERPAKGRKQKEPTPEESENEEESDDQSDEAPAKPAKKENKTSGNSAKGRKQKESTPEESEDEESSDEDNKKSKKGKSEKSAKPKAGKSKESAENGNSKKNDENKPKRKAATKKNKQSDDEDDDEPEKKKSKVEPKKLMNKTDSDLEKIDYGCNKLNADGEKFNLKITSWNVSGIRALIKKNGMEYLLKEDADIIALQETKCADFKLPDEVKLPGYERYFLDSESKSGYCGVAFYSKVKPIEVKFGMKNSNCNDEGRMIVAEFEKYYVVNVYVPNAGQKLVTLPKRLQWNEDFKTYMQTLDAKKPVIICGDLNVAHNEIDLKNPKTNTKNAGFTKEERDGMTDFLAQGFVDTFRQLYPDQVDAYTFWAYFNNARAKNVGWRLDYFLVSERISNNVCDNVIRDKVYGSDHCPVVLYLTM